MRNVYDCVVAFEKLLNKEYHLILGRKGIAVSLQINFGKKECFHSNGASISNWQTGIVSWQRKNIWFDQKPSDNSRTAPVVRLVS